jgi:hypothetical protein
MGLYLVEPVHGAVAGVLVHARQAVDVDVVADPVGGGELGGGGEGAGGDQGEQDAFGVGQVAAPPSALLRRGGDRLGDVQAVPELVQGPTAAQRAGLDEGQVGAGGSGQGVGRVQQPGQGVDQAFDGGAVESVLAAEGVQQARHRASGDRVPLVVGQVQVAHGAVLGLPTTGLHVHRSRPYTALAK